jgi:deoxyribose-phosphate aldolase
MKVNSYIDHTFLKPFGQQKDIFELCEAAKKFEFFSVCINSCHILYAKELLNGSKVAVCTVVGFPLGATATKAKIFEAETALYLGADEIDMVINLGDLKDKKFELVKNEIVQIKEVTGKKVLKVILETCYLTEEEKIAACKICVEAGADFVKTSTGFGSAGATIEDIKLMKQVVKENAKIKASGGIRDYATAKLFIDNGADRLGTSNSVAIAKGM